jgi:hypothetical protein
VLLREVAVHVRRGQHLQVPQQPQRHQEPGVRVGRLFIQPQAHQAQPVTSTSRRTPAGSLD